MPRHTCSKIIIAFGALFLFWSPPLVEASPTASPRIYGGGNSSATKSIALLIEADNVHNYVLICSGTFLSSTHFLTAKHCVGNNGFKNPSFFIFRSLSKAPIRVISRKGSSTDDIAILKFRPTNVSPVPILLSHSPTIGETVQFYGYGADQFQKNALQKGVKHFLKFGQSQLSAATASILSFVNSPSGGACHGDSGGPMIVLNQSGNPGIVGVASYVEGVDVNHCRSGNISSYVNLQSDSALSFISKYAPEALIN